MSNPNSPFDLQQALEYVDGFEDVLSSTAEVFIEEYPQLLDAIRQARSEEDSVGVSRAAHTLKGSTALFAASAATEAALNIEERGKAGDLSAVDAILPQLQHELRLLAEALAEFIKQAGASDSQTQP